MNRSLRIGIDIRTLETPEAQRRGFGRYVTNLVRAMVRRAPQHRYLLYGNSFPWEVLHLQSLLNLHGVSYDIYRPSYHEDIDVFLLTEPLSMRLGVKVVESDLKDTPCATIFYDLIPLIYEQQYLSPNPELRDHFFRNIEVLQHTAQRYLAISDFVAHDLAQRLPINPHQIVSINGGLDEMFQRPPSSEEIAAVLRRYNLNQPYFFYTGGSDYRKNIDGLLRAFQQVCLADARPLKLVLAGELDGAWRAAVQKGETGNPNTDRLQALGFVSDEDLRALYGGATALVFPSFYEGFGLPALEAMASNCPVIVSHSTALQEVVGDAGLLIDPQNPKAIAQAMLRLLHEPQLGQTLRTSGLKRSRLFTWDRVAQSALSALEDLANPKKTRRAPVRKLRVALQNRANVFSQPGGDTMVMEQLYRNLRARDVEVEVVGADGDLSSFDLAHFINLTVRETPRIAAANAAKHNVPMVLTTLFEDWPRHMERSIQACYLFRDYLLQNKNEALFSQGLTKLRDMQDDSHVGNDDVVAAAARLFTCGETEARQLQREYPGCADKTRIIKFGSTGLGEIRGMTQNAIRKILGFDRFILCCGRLETRKNQLMLLKALDDLDLPIVFAGGGFTYQAAYEKLVRSWPRKAPVVVLGRLSGEVLANLMAAASAHVLTSWYELPGLVTLEAAQAGTAVVASDWGAIRDYLPEGTAHFCQPDDPSSIRRAVESALQAGPNPQAKKIASDYTWEAFGDATLTAYEELLTSRSAPRTIIAKTKNMNNNAPEDSMLQPTENATRFDASIILPVYEGAPGLSSCLETICAAETQANYELILVDNHTSESTVRQLQTVEGDVTVLRLPEARSTAAAMNAGVRVAGGQYVVCLNDVEQVKNGWLDALIACARTQANDAVVGAKCLASDGTIAKAGIVFDEEKAPHAAGAGLPEHDPSVNQTRDNLQALTENCLLVPRELWLSMEGCAEEFASGWAGIDFTLRALQMGAGVVYCPQAVVTLNDNLSGALDDSRQLQAFQKRWSQYIQVDFPLSNTQDATPNNGEALNLERARALYAAGDLEAAAEALQAIVENRLVLAAEDSFEVWQTFGNALTRLNRLDEAEKAYYTAIRHNEASIRPYLGLGSVAMLQENWQAAMISFMTALSKDPTTTKGEFGVGIALAARKMHQDAMQHFERVIEREPDNAEALFYYYRSAMENGQAESAIQPIENYLTRHPQDTNFLFNLCGAYWKSGQITKAVDVCQQVLERQPDHTAARDVLQHLTATVPVHA